MAVLLAVQAVIFVAWAVLAFRVVIRLRARACALSGTAWPGLADQIAALRGFLADPAEARLRHRCLLLTVLLLALSVGQAIWLSPPG